MESQETSVLAGPGLCVTGGEHGLPRRSPCVSSGTGGMNADRGHVEPSTASAAEGAAPSLLGRAKTRLFNT